MSYYRDGNESEDELDYTGHRFDSSFHAPRIQPRWRSLVDFVELVACRLSPETPYRLHTDAVRLGRDNDDWWIDVEFAMGALVSRYDQLADDQVRRYRTVRDATLSFGVVARIDYDAFLALLIRRARFSVGRFMNLEAEELPRHFNFCLYSELAPEEYSWMMLQDVFGDQNFNDEFTAHLKLIDEMAQAEAGSVNMSWRLRLYAPVVLKLSITPSSTTIENQVAIIRNITTVVGKLHQVEDNRALKLHVDSTGKMVPPVFHLEFLEALETLVTTGVRISSLTLPEFFGDDGDRDISKLMTGWASFVVVTLGARPTKRVAKIDHLVVPSIYTEDLFMAPFASVLRYTNVVKRRKTPFWLVLPRSYVGEVLGGDPSDASLFMLVPGFGFAFVEAANVRYVNGCRPRMIPRRSVTELIFNTKPSRRVNGEEGTACSARVCLPRLLECIGGPLTFLGVIADDIDNEAMEMILRSCHGLDNLLIDSPAVVSLNHLTDTYEQGIGPTPSSIHLRGVGIRVVAIDKFLARLGQHGHPLQENLRQLAIGQNWTHRFAQSTAAQLHTMLANNRRLTHLYVHADSELPWHPGTYHGYDGEPIPGPPLSPSSRFAFLGVLKQHHVTRGLLTEDLLRIVFEFAREPVYRLVVRQAPGSGTMSCDAFHPPMASPFPSFSYFLAVGSYLFSKTKPKQTAPARLSERELCHFACEPLLRVVMREFDSFGIDFDDEF